MAVTLSLTDPYLSSFEAFAKASGEADPPWLRKLRMAAIGNFRASGFPTT